MGHNNESGKGSYKFIILCIIALFIGLLGGYLYLNFRSNQKTTEYVPPVQKTVDNQDSVWGDEQLVGDIDGSSSMKSGKYIRLEGDQLTYKDSENKELKVPVPSEQVLLECSKVNIGGLTKYDFKNSYSVKPVKPIDVGNYLKEGDSILVIYDLGSIGKPSERINSIIVNTKNCPD